ncbi:MAG: DUF4390 domain-containing protein, partial [Gammaproteobacteria bacterium]
RHFTNNHKPRFSLLLSGLISLALLYCSPVHAEPAFKIKHAETILVDKVYNINASIEFEFSDEALGALKNGVPLIILFDIEVEKKRNWWINKNVATLEQGYLLLYHALSKKFVLHNLNSGTQENYSSLDSALYALGNIQQLPILDADLLEKDADYIFRLKSFLDIESLPPPMRPLAYVSSEWQLESDWYTWTLNQ